MHVGLEVCLGLCRRALKKADEAMKDDEALQSMTDGMSDSAEKMQPQVRCPSATPA